MAKVKVKGSKHYNLVLKSHRPKHTLAWRVAMTGLIGVLGLAAFWGGRVYEQQRQALEPAERQQLRLAQERLAEVAQDQEIDRVAVESSRAMIKGLEAEVGQLKKAVAFYRGVIAPKENRQGLQVYSFTSYPTAEPGRYRLGWVLAHVGKSASKRSAALEGSYSMEFVAYNGAEQITIALKDVLVEPINNQFKFQYFQNFSAEVKIPETVTVDRVVIKATARCKKPQKVSREYAWQLTEEALANAGE